MSEISKMHVQESWDSCAQDKRRKLKRCTFRNYGTHVRRTKRRKSKEMHFQELWDSCAQNKTAEISKIWLSGILGLRLAEQTSEISKNVTFVFALNKAHVLALNTAHVLRLNRADVLAVNREHVLRLNTKICPVLTPNTKATTKGGWPRAAPLSGGGRKPPPLCWL